MFLQTEIKDVQWFNGERIRFIFERDGCWFVAADVCRAFGVGVGSLGVPNVTHTLRFLPRGFQRLEKLETHPHLKPPYSKFVLISLSALLMLAARKGDAPAAAMAADPMFVAWLAQAMETGGCGDAARVRVALDDALREADGALAGASENPSRANAPTAAAHLRTRHIFNRTTLFDETKMMNDGVFARYWNFRLLREEGRVASAAKMLDERASMVIVAARGAPLAAARLDGARAIERAAHAFDETVDRVSSVYEAVRVDGGRVENERVVDYRFPSDRATRRFRVRERIQFDSDRIVALWQSAEPL